MSFAAKYGHIFTQPDVGGISLPEQEFLRKYGQEQQGPSTSDLSNAASDFVDEQQGLLYGIAGYAGDVTGIDGLRDWGYEGYQRNMGEVSANQRDAYDIDYLMENGSVGDWADALQYHGIKGGLNLISTIATGGIGSAIAKRAAATAIKKSLAQRVAAGAPEGFAERAMGSKAVQGAIQSAGPRGFYGGAAANAFGAEIGETWGQAAEEQQARVGNIENVDLLKATAGGIAAGSLEFVGDVATLGLAKMLPGQKGVMQGFMQRPSWYGRVGVGATVNAPIEGLTEMGQHHFETWGADKPTYGAEYEHGLRQSAFAGAVGGGAAGTINILNRPVTQDDGPTQDTLPAPESTLGLGLQPPTGGFPLPDRDPYAAMRQEEMAQFQTTPGFTRPTREELPNRFQSPDFSGQRDPMLEAQGFYGEQQEVVPQGSTLSDAEIDVLLSGDQQEYAHQELADFVNGQDVSDKAKNSMFKKGTQELRRDFISTVERYSLAASKPEGLAMVENRANGGGTVASVAARYVLSKLSQENNEQTSPTEATPQGPQVEENGNSALGGQDQAAGTPQTGDVRAVENGAPAAPVAPIVSNAQPWTFRETIPANVVGFGDGMMGLTVEENTDGTTGLPISDAAASSGQQNTVDGTGVGTGRVPGITGVQDERGDEAGRDAGNDTATAQPNQPVAVPEARDVRVAEQTLSEPLQKLRNSLLSKGGRTLAGQETTASRVFDYLVNNDNLDLIGSGKSKKSAVVNHRAIAEAVGIRGKNPSAAVSMAMRRIRQKFDTELGGDVKALLAEKNKQTRKVEEAAAINDAVSVLDERELLQTADGDTKPGMQIIGSTNTADVKDELAQEGEAVALAQPDPVNQKRVEEASARRDQLVDAVLQAPELDKIRAEAVAHWDAERTADMPTAAELPKDLTYNWLLDYTEYANLRTDDDQIAQDQQDITDEFRRRQGGSPKVLGDSREVRDDVAGGQAGRGALAEDTGSRREPQNAVGTRAKASEVSFVNVAERVNALPKTSKHRAKAQSLLEGVNTALSSFRSDDAASLVPVAEAIDAYNQFQPKGVAKRALPPISLKELLPTANEAVENTNTTPTDKTNSQVSKSVATTTPTGSNKDKAATISAILQDLIVDASHWRVHVFNTVDEAVKASNLSKDELGNTQAFVKDIGGTKHAYFILDNINAGQELAVFIHEVGSHIGLENILSAQEIDQLYDHITRWAKSGKGVEGTIAKRALARVEAAKRAGDEITGRKRVRETIAYFLEEAVNAGITPTAYNNQSPLLEWLRKISRAFHNALRKLGLDTATLSAHDVVDLAYGAAGIALTYEATQPKAQTQQTKKQKSHFANLRARVKRVKQLYGEENYAAYRNEARGFLEKAKEGGHPFGYSAISPLIERLRKSSDRIHERLVQHFGPAGTIVLGRPSALRDDSATLGKFKGITTEFLVEEDFEDGGYIARLDVFVNEFHDTNPDSPPALSFWVGSDGQLTITAAEDTTDTFAWLKERGSIDYARDATKNIAYMADGRPWTRMEGTKLSEQARLLAELHARIRHLSPDLKHVGIKWHRATGATGADVTEVIQIGDVGQNSQQNDGMVDFGRSTAVYFSKRATPQQTTEKIADAIYNSKVPEYLKDPLFTLTVSTRDFLKRAGYYAAFGHDLADMVGNLIPEAKRFFALNGEKDAVRQKYEEAVDNIMSMAHKVKNKTQMEAFIKDSTSKQAWGYQPTWMKDNAGNQTKVKIDPAMQARWNAMPADARKVADEIFQYGYETRNELRKLVKGELNAGFDAELAGVSDKEKQEIEQRRMRQLRLFDKNLAQLQGPYAPLSRFGDYVVIYKSDRFLEAEDAKDNKWLEENQMNPDHYMVAFTDSMGDAALMARNLKIDKHITGSKNVVAKPKEVFTREGTEAPWNAMRRLKTMLDAHYRDQQGKGNDKDLKAAHRRINSMLSDLYLTTLAETSARKHNMRRRTIAGASDEMLRAFATKGKLDAHFIAALHSNGKVTDSLQLMREQAKDSDNPEDAQRAMNEILQRHALGMEYRPTPIQDKIMQFNSIWTLLTKPGYYLQNLTQPWMMSLPYMATIRGVSWDRASRELLKTYGQIGPAFKNETFIKGLLDGTFNIDALNIPADEKQLLHKLHADGRLGVGIARDLGYWESRGGMTQPVADALHRMNTWVKQVELINRATTALATYRLTGRGVAGTAKAVEVLNVTHGDYSGSNAPRMWSLPGAKVALQFRKFQMIQLGFLARLSHGATFGDEKERAGARKALAWTMAHYFVMTGVNGLPLMAVAAALMMDSDEPEDFDQWFTENVVGGDKALATLLLKGAPTLAGMDLSGMLGAQNAASLLPFTDVKLLSAEPGDKSKYGELLMGLSGSFIGGTLPTMWKGVKQIEEGDYYKGVENLLPSGFKKAMQGYRFATDGYTNKRGDVTLSADEISFWDSFTHGIGLRSVDIATMQEANSRKFKTEEFFNSKTSSITNRYLRAHKAKDSAEMVSLRKEYVELQKKRREAGLKPQPVSKLLRAPMEQKKREQNTIGGLQYTSGNRQLVENLTQ